MSEPARLAAVWIKRAFRGPMDSVDSARLVRERGIVGNANSGGRRQVTILEREVWERLTSRLGASLDPSARRANFLVEGIDLLESRGRILRCGEVRIRIRGETKPCERMDEALPGLKDLMWPEWGGGAYGEVETDGTVRVGDELGWEE